MIAALIPVIGTVISKIFDVVDESVEDKDERNRLKQEVQLKLMSMSHDETREMASIIRAEAQSESWLAQSWRPITMLTFVAIVANNFIIHPYLQLFGLPSTQLEITDGMWTLLTVGVGGYIGSRGIEKVAKTWKEK